MGLAGPAYQQAKAQFLDFLLSPGVRSWIAYTPADDLAALNVPTLALFGGKDFQVPAEMNASALRAFELSGEAVTGRATHQVIGGPGGVDGDIYRQLVVEAGVELAGARERPMTSIWRTNSRLSSLRLGANTIP